MDDSFEHLLAMVMMAACADEAEEQATKRRRIWSKEWLLERPKFSNMELLEKLHQTEPLDFQNFLRMDIETFEALLDLVTPYIKKKDTVMREAITPKARLAVTLRFLATGNSFEDLKFSSAISPQSIGEIVIETCEAICVVLKDCVKKYRGY